jgi:tetratricopeptide (TPR) repeat protein
VLFVCAMFSKTVACTLPVSLLVLVWWKRGAIARRDALLIAPLVPFGVGLGLFTAHLEREHAGAEGATWAFSWAERCLIAGRALWFYLQSVLWPGERVFIPRRWHIDAGDAAQYVYPIAVLVLFAALWRLRARIGRGPLAAALIYAITLFPALGFFNVYSYKFSFAYDHFQYLAVPAPLALLSAAVVTRVRALAATPQSIAIVAAALVLAACGALTWRQSCIYQNPETLWRHTLRWNPDCWLGHRNLANAALAAGHTDEAIAELRAALRLDGRDAEGHNNLGVAYGWKGKRDESIAEFKRALAVDPKFLPTYRNLAIALALAGREDEARKVLAFQQKISQPAAGYSSSARP